MLLGADGQETQLQGRCDEHNSSIPFSCVPGGCTPGDPAWIAGATPRSHTQPVTAPDHFAQNALMFSPFPWG